MVVLVCCITLFLTFIAIFLLLTYYFIKKRTVWNELFNLNTIIETVMELVVCPEHFIIYIPGIILETTECIKKTQINNDTKQKIKTVLTKVNQCINKMELIDYNNNNNNDNNDNNNNNDNNLINSDAVNNIDALLDIGIHNKEMFSDTTEESKDDIKSIFTPKIVIGKNDNLLENPDRWNNVFSGNEFNGNRNRNRNRNNDDDYSNRGGNGSGNRGGNRGGNGNSCDGGSGVGNGVSNGNSYDSISSDEDIATYTDKKRCGKYDDIRENEDGSIIVQNYSDAKTWNPGYTYLPPSNWDVPQKRAPVCSAPSPNTIKLTGLVDRGLPLNVLELHPYDGKIAKTEDSVKLTNVGSMLPKFKYEEQPFSKPYI